MTHTPLKVLFVTHAFPRFPGDAAGAFVLALARALTAQGVEVRVLAPSAPGLAVRDIIDGIVVHRYRYAPAAWETLAYAGTMAEQVGGSLRGKMALTLLLARGRRAVRAEVDGWNPHLIHAHWWFPSGVQARGHGAPVVITMHGSDIRLMRTDLARALFRRVAARASALFAVSGWLARQAGEALRDRQIGVAPMPAATMVFGPSADVTRDSSRMLFVGRLNEQKGISALLDAMARARRSWTLDIVGDGPSREALQEKARVLGLADRVHWLGHLPQTALPPLYQRSSALIIPSINEGLGLVGVEAALCETPAIAFASGGLPDVVQDGVTGWLVPAGDLAALAHAIDGVVDRPSVARAAGTAAHARALATYSSDAVGGRYREAYDAVLGATR